jgi:NAD+ synthase (glutamine-hydrolysing)
MIGNPEMLGHVEIDPADWECWTIFKALCLHMADYKRRCGFQRAVIGLSGGIDSAVVAVIAREVFGSENVMGIAMPSPYSSEGSVADARALAENLKIGFQIKNITETYEAVKRLFLSGGKPEFASSLTDENIQPRARGMILMAHSNEFDPCLLLTTGNKSEIAIGYCTIYGDMCGGLAVISDLWKSQVYKLAAFINRYFDVIPPDTITKPASAELKPDQKDTDSLPPYEVLDPLLRLIVEQEMSPVQVFATGWFKARQGLGADQIDSGTVNAMYRKYRTAEYKRQQMPPGPKLQQRSFGSGRRMPIAMKLTTVGNIP